MDDVEKYKSHKGPVDDLHIVDQYMMEVQIMSDVLSRQCCQRGQAGWARRHRGGSLCFWMQGVVSVLLEEAEPASDSCWTRLNKPLCKQLQMIYYNHDVVTLSATFTSDRNR